MIKQLTAKTADKIAKVAYTTLTKVGASVNSFASVQPAFLVA